MLDLASIRRDAAAAPGNVIAMGKDQLDQLLLEAELGHIARRTLRLLSAVDTILPSAAKGPTA